MRNIRARRRLGFILISLLVICVILFIEDRIDAFVPDVKNFAEERIEDAFGGKITLSIGDIDGGLLHPITLNDIKIGDVNNAGILPSLKISSIKTNYRVWDLVRAAYIAKVKGAGAVSRFLSGVTRLDVNFVTADEKLNGFIRFTNISGELAAKGCVNLSSGEKIAFSGKIKDGAYDLEIRPRRGVIKARGSLSRDGALDMNFKVYHADIGGHDLVCDGTMKSDIVAAGKEVKRPAIEGTIDTKNTVLNYRPFLNLKTSYRIADGRLFISELSLSDIFKAHGIFQLREPFNTNAVVTVNNLSMNWFAGVLGAKDASSIMSGNVNAKCDFKGPIANLRSNVQLDVRGGTIATLEFESLSARFKGEGPIVRIEDSRITRDSGAFVLAGEMDMRKMGRGSLFENIRLVGDDKAINWDGWKTSKTQNTREINMRKKITDDIDFNFKKFVTEDTIDESMKYGDEVQFDYKLHPNESLTVMVGQDKEFLGIEHKNKF